MFLPEWIPSTFKRPDPEPYPDWDVRTSKPIPYRPFRYGPYVFLSFLVSKKKGKTKGWLLTEVIFCDLIGSISSRWVCGL